MAKNATGVDLEARVEAFVAAYNRQDFDAVEQMLAPDLRFWHHNRAHHTTTRDEWLAVIRTFASDYVPDRRLSDALRQTVVGNIVYREQLWTGTAKVDLPGMGDAGERIELRFCTVLEFDDDGLVVEYHDYG